MSCMIAGTSPTGAPASISYPPWPGGEPLRGGPLGEGGAHTPPVDPRQTNDPAPRMAITVPNARPRDHVRQLFFLLLLPLLLFAHLDKLEVVEGGYGVVNQLFCHLRHRENRALRDDVVESDLGRFDHLLRHHGVARPEHFHQLDHSLRHRSVEHRQGHNDVRWSAARCAAGPAPVDQTRRADGLVWSHRRQAPRQRPWQSTGCLPPGEWGSSGSSPCSSIRSPTPRSWPSSVPVGRHGAGTWPGASAA